MFKGFLKMRQLGNPVLLLGGSIITGCWLLSEAKNLHQMDLCFLAKIMFQGEIKLEFFIKPMLAILSKEITNNTVLVPEYNCFKTIMYIT